MPGPGVEETREEGRKSSSPAVSGRGLEWSIRSSIMPLSYPTQGERSQASLFFFLIAVGSQGRDRKSWMWSVPQTCRCKGSGWQS